MTDKADLPLSVIRAALTDAEAEVAQALQRFRDRTGMVIVGAEIETVTVQKMSDERLQVFPVRVRLETQGI